MSRNYSFGCRNGGKHGRANEGSEAVHRRFRGGWPELEGTLIAGAEQVNRSLGGGSSELQTLGLAASGVVRRSSGAPSSMP